MSGNIDIRLRIIEENTNAVDRLRLNIRKANDEAALGAIKGKEYSRKALIERKENAIALREEIIERRKIINQARAEIGIIKQRRMAYLGVGLSMLFLGMSLKRFSEQALRSLINTYATVMGQTSTFGIMTNRLAASWEYLKWSIMNALERTGLMDLFIGAVQKAVNFFIDLDDSAKIAIATIAGAGWITGTILTPMGQVITAMSADWAQMGTNIGLLKDKATDLVPILQKAVGVVAIYFAFEAAADAFEYFSDGRMGDGLLASLKTAALASGGWLMFKGKTGKGGALLAIGMALELVGRGTLFQTFTATLATLGALVAAAGMTYEGYMTKFFFEPLANGIIAVLNIARSALLAAGNFAGAARLGAMQQSVKDDIGARKAVYSTDFFTNFENAMEGPFIQGMLGFGKRADAIVDAAIQKLNMQTVQVSLNGNLVDVSIPAGIDQASDPVAFDKALRDALGSGPLPPPVAGPLLSVQPGRLGQANSTTVYVQNAIMNQTTTGMIMEASSGVLGTPFT
jgi:hypothetical protein